LRGEKMARKTRRKGRKAGIGKRMGRAIRQAF